MGFRNLWADLTKARRKYWDNQFVANVESGPTLLNDEYLTAINAAGTGLVNVIKVNASDQVELNVDLAMGQTVTLATNEKVQFRDTGIYINSGADGKLTVSADGTGTDDITLAGTVSISDDVLLATDKKVGFRDSGLFIQSGADGKLTISADGTGADDITLAGTVTVSDTLTMAALKAIALSAGGFTMAAIARTATTDGTTTGTIADGPTLQFITVTVDNADKIIILPTPTPGSIVILANAATGYELRSSAPATVGINGGTGSNVESAIPANTLVLVICESATSWKGLQLGSDGTLAKVEVAA